MSRFENVVICVIPDHMGTWYASATVNYITGVVPFEVRIEERITLTTGSTSVADQLEEILVKYCQALAKQIDNGTVRID